MDRLLLDITSSLVSPTSPARAPVKSESDSPIRLRLRLPASGTSPLHRRVVRASHSLWDLGFFTSTSAGRTVRFVRRGRHIAAHVAPRALRMVDNRAGAAIRNPRNRGPILGFGEETEMLLAVGTDNFDFHTKPSPEFWCASLSKVRTPDCLKREDDGYSRRVQAISALSCSFATFASRVRACCSSSCRAAASSRAAGERSADRRLRRLIGCPKRGEC
jgi:hypothetical protein